MAKCIIIGAGISGVVAADFLQAQGHSVQVLEKSRGIGGRMATREIEGGQFDFGAQYLATHGMFFRCLAEDMEDNGVLAQWCRGFLNADGILHSDGYLRYKPTKGMKYIPRYLAEHVNVSLEQKVTKLAAHDNHWQVHTEDKTYEADAVLLSAPLPQALTLLTKDSQLDLDPDQIKKLKEIKYDPCIAVMALLDGPSGLPEPGALSSRDPMSPIAWISDNQAKGISELPAVTILGTPHFSRSHWKGDREEAGQKLLDKAKDYLKANPTTVQVHKWRYSQPKTTWEKPFVSLTQEGGPPLLLIGDAFGRLSHPIEGAAVSGIKAAKALTKHYQKQETPTP